MLVRTPADFGAVIRDRRKQLKLDQATFAKRVGVSRQWIILIEQGHPRAELGLVLRAIAALDIELDANAEAPRQHRSDDADIDAIVAKAKKSQP